MRHSAAPVARWLALAVLVTVASACGTRAAGGTPAAAATPPPRASLPSFAASMNPDGTVPWSGAPAVDPYLLATPPPVPPAAGPTCTAARLRGLLPSWIYNASYLNGENVSPLLAGSMHGYVVLTNISARPCTLRGAPAVTVLSRGAPVQADYGRFGTGTAAPAGLPPGGQANFRIDWDAPYCPGQRGELPGPPDHGPFSIRATFDGLTMTIPVRSTASPACVIGDPEPHGNRSSVATSPIAPGAAPPAHPVPQPSALRQLRAAAGAYPRQVAPGQTLRFVIALANPAGRPVSLTGPPPPSYAIGVTCARTPATPGYQFGRPYSLNTGPRPSVPAHGVVRFAMQVQIPATPACPSRRLAITWQSPSPGFGLQGPRTSFSVAVT